MTLSDPGAAALPGAAGLPEDADLPPGSSMPQLKILKAVESKNVHGF